MHKTFAGLSVLLALAGCATTASHTRDDQARRQNYVAAHPENPYTRQILKGQIVAGMSLADVNASYDYCAPATEFPDQHSWRCQTPKMAKAHKMGMLVQFDYTDHVTSVTR